jgi:hypothetical protein
LTPAMVGCRGASQTSHKEQMRPPDAKLQELSVPDGAMGCK